MAHGNRHLFIPRWTSLDHRWRSTSHHIQPVSLLGRQDAAQMLLQDRANCRLVFLINLYAAEICAGLCPMRWKRLVRREASSFSHWLRLAKKAWIAARKSPSVG